MKPLLTQEKIERQITEMYDAIVHINDPTARTNVYKQANEIESRLRAELERQNQLSRIANDAKYIFHVHNPGDLSVGIGPAYGTIIFDTNIILGEEEIKMWKEFIGEFFEVVPKYVLTDEEYHREQRLIIEEETKLEF